MYKDFLKPPYHLKMEAVSWVLRSIAYILFSYILSLLNKRIEIKILLSLE